MRHINGIVRVHKQGNIVFHLLFISVVKFVKGFEIFHIACLDTGGNASVVAVGKYHFQRAAHVEERRVMPAFGFS